MKDLYGTGVALVTPFDAAGNIDYDALQRLLKHTSDQGVDYYVVMGTTGESATTTAAEKAAILEFVKKNNADNLPIVYGLGGNNTQELVHLVKNVNLNGVHAILSVSPYYNKPSQEGIYQHYKIFADESPVPVILYNVPGRTGSNISASTTLRLAEHNNIIGIKEASGNFSQAMEISRKKPPEFMLISGDDMDTLPLMSVGAVGVISVLANAYAGIFTTLFSASKSGDFQAAREAVFKLLDLNPLMYEEGNPVGVKQVLKELKVCENYVRPPLMAASESLQKRILNVISGLS